MRRLPTIRHKGIEYFIDERLREFRSNTRPIDFIPFNSERGRAMINEEKPFPFFESGI